MDDPKLQKKELNKQYYALNKDKHLAYMKEKIDCNCGELVQRSTIKRHKRSRKHLDAFGRKLKFIEREIDMILAEPDDMTKTEALTELMTRLRNQA